MKNNYYSLIQRDTIIIYALAILTIIGGTEWWHWTHPRTNPNSQQQTNLQVEGFPKSTSLGKTQLTEIVKSPLSTKIQAEKILPKVNSVVSRIQPQTYWLKIEGENIKLIPQKFIVEKGTSSKTALTKTLNYLLRTPQQLEQNQSLTTTIPMGTRLLNLEINDSEVNINLSKEFTTGGGSTSMIYRVAQIVYTASSINPSYKIYLSVEGELLDENYPLGGEGLVFREPVTRQQLVEDFSIN